MDIARATNNLALRDAMAVLVDHPDLSPAERREQADRLLSYAERSGGSLDNCLVAREGVQVIASCLCVDAPGRTSSVFIPPMIGKQAVADAVIALLVEAIQLARQRNIQVVQAMVAPEADEEASLLVRSGFERLAELIYLDSDLTKPVLVGKHPPTLSWATYSDRTHDLFARVIQGTYEGSLDCVRLNGIRDIEDIIASHRATGQFDPDSWLLGMVGSEPVGTLLLGYLPERWSYEIIYMGLLPARRGQGCGAALLKKAVEMVREKAGVTLSLAVDAQNHPAQKLYARFGFVEVSRRDIWVHLLC